MEVFKPIQNFEDKYLVSNQGRVWSLLRDRFLKISTKKYHSVGIAGKKKVIHRLVAQAFIPILKTFLWFNHIDHDKFNNDWTNLEWTTNKDNLIHYHHTKKSMSPL